LRGWYKGVDWWGRCLSWRIMLAGSAEGGARGARRTLWCRAPQLR
jgi:hypothetical protein